APVAAPLPAALAEPGEPSAERYRKEDRETVQRVVTKLTEAARTLQVQQEQQLEEMQRVAVELAVAISSRVPHERIEAGDLAVEALVRQVVQRLDPKQPVTVYLHPEDLSLLEKRLTDGQPLIPESTELRLSADATLSRGDCRAEAGDLSVLAHLEE